MLKGGVASGTEAACGERVGKGLKFVTLCGMLTLLPCSAVDSLRVATHHAWPRVHQVQCLTETTEETASQHLRASHWWEVVSLFANFRILMKRIFPKHAWWGQLSEQRVGLLGMVASSSVIAKIYCETQAAEAAKRKAAGKLITRSA